MKSVIFGAILLVLTAIAAPAQSGGNYEITQTVSTTGGKVSGGNFTIEYTVGQPIAADSFPSIGFTMNIGFWTPNAFQPTAASVGVSGRVATPGGTGVPNMIVVLADGAGASRSVRTNSFGNYVFDGVPSGSTYVVTVAGRGFTVAQPVRVVFVGDAVVNVDFTADESNQTPQN